MGPGGSARGCADGFSFGKHGSQGKQAGMGRAGDARGPCFSVPFPAGLVLLGTEALLEGEEPQEVWCC